MDGALDLSSKGTPPCVSSTPQDDLDNKGINVDIKSDHQHADSDGETEDISAPPSPEQQKATLPTNKINNPLLGQIPAHQFPLGLTNYMDMAKAAVSGGVLNHPFGGHHQTHPGGPGMAGPFSMYPMEPIAAATAAMYNPITAAAAMGMGFPFPLGTNNGLPQPQTLFNNTVKSPSPVSQLINKKRKRYNHPTPPVVSEVQPRFDNPILQTSSGETFQNRTMLSDNKVSTSDVTGGSIANKKNFAVDETEHQIERKRKNNDAAKRSRDTRRIKETEVALRAALLEEENLKLKAQVAVLKNETSKLHIMLYQM